MFILKNGHQPGVYVPLRALFLVFRSDKNFVGQTNFHTLSDQMSCKLLVHIFISNGGLSKVEGSIVATDNFGTSTQLIEIVTKTGTYWTLQELFGRYDSAHFSIQYFSAHFSGTTQFIFVYKDDKAGV